MYKIHNKKIILASASPRRKDILEKTGLKFRVEPGNYDENFIPGMQPRTLARYLSMKKAESIAWKYKKALIIAADTFIVFRSKIFGKPLTEIEAKKMLITLNGKTHSVITGFTIIDTENKRTLSRSIETKVTFRKLTEREIDTYIRSKEPFDKAGAYAIQGLGALLIRKIEGDYLNVVGLPLNALVQSLLKFGVKVK